MYTPKPRAETLAKRREIGKKAGALAHERAKGRAPMDAIRVFRKDLKEIGIFAGNLGISKAEAVHRMMENVNV